MQLVDQSNLNSQERRLVLDKCDMEKDSKIFDTVKTEMRKMKNSLVDIKDDTWK